ncbi:twin transmembrane helix small protein [Castellaniella sp. MT123]|uniref:twin transmembrane helix small protein n=1 Tax=Castellaniella sp. MT123 TaxID=3140381 RepID=UPI0031F36691|nr:twin transmembrane helix small protein [Castellaniella sp.]
MKVLIVILFLAIVASLGSALMFLMQDRGRSNRMAWALTWRVGLSILLFLFLLLANAMGWIHATGVPMTAG